METLINQTRPRFFVRIKYAYDRSDNRAYRENTIAANQGKHFDELYLHDLINRLKHMDRGSLDSQRTTINNLQFSECWGLDATGNWQNFREDDDGDSLWDLVQNRIANRVNEITDITESVGLSWVTPAYSKAGNMTTIPQPADPTKSFTGTYDAWNRLVKIVNNSTSNTIAACEYDGVKRQTIKTTYSGGVLDETRNLYYSDPDKWQLLEERVNASTEPGRQFVWGLRYQDDLILRDRDTTGNSVLDERLYGLQDANWNLTSISDTTGSIQERYSYSAYGTPAFLDSSFNSRASSSYAWETLFAGYRWCGVSQFYHVRHRILAPRIGWLQRDRLELSAGVNLYEYVYSRPLLYTDPTGEDFRVLLVVVGIVIILLFILFYLSGGCQLTEALVGRREFEQCNTSDPRMICAMQALSDCGFAAAAARMTVGMTNRSVLCNPSADAVGSAASTIEGNPDRPGTTVILTNSVYNCGDIAMQLHAEDARRLGSPPEHNAELAEFLACLNGDPNPDRHPAHKWAHP